MKKIMFLAALTLTPAASAQVTPVQRAELNQMARAFTGVFHCGNGKVLRFSVDTPGPDGLFDYNALAGEQIDKLVNAQVSNGNAVVKKVGPVPGGGKQVWLLTKEKTQMYFAVTPATDALTVQVCEMVKVR